MVRSKHVKNYSHGGFVSYSDWVSRNTPANMGDMQEDNWLAGGARQAYNKAKREYDNTQHVTNNNTSNNNTQTNTNTIDDGPPPAEPPIQSPGLPPIDPPDGSITLPPAGNFSQDNVQTTTTANTTGTADTGTTNEGYNFGNGFMSPDEIGTPGDFGQDGVQTTNTQGTPISRSEWLNANRPAGGAAADNWDAGAGVAAYNRYLNNFNVNLFG